VFRCIKRLCVSQRLAVFLETGAGNAHSAKTLNQTGPLAAPKTAFHGGVTAKNEKNPKPAFRCFSQSSVRFPKVPNPKNCPGFGRWPIFGWRGIGNFFSSALRSCRMLRSSIFWLTVAVPKWPGLPKTAGAANIFGRLNRHPASGRNLANPKSLMLGVPGQPAATANPKRVRRVRG